MPVLRFLRLLTHGAGSGAVVPLDQPAEVGSVVESVDGRDPFERMLISADHVDGNLQPHPPRILHRSGSALFTVMTGQGVPLHNEMTGQA